MQTNTDSLSILKGNKKLLFLFYALFSAVLILMIFIFKSFIWPFLFALVLYIVLRSLNNYLIKYLKSRWLCSTIIIFLIIIFILIPLFFILFKLAYQAYDFYLYIQNQYDQGTFDDLFKSYLVKKLLSYVNVAEINIFKQLVELLGKTSFSIFSNLTAILSFSVKFILNIFFMLVILFFLFKDGDSLSEKFYKAMPFPDDMEKNVVHRINMVIKIVFTGNLFIMILQGAVVGISFAIFGLAAPLLWACVTAILSLIPVVGTSIVWVPAILYLAFKGYYASAVIMGLLCLLGYLILENLVKPKVFGKKLNFHPLIFFFLLIGSIHIFNLPGIVIGPVLLTLLYSLWEIYKILNGQKTGQ